MSVQLAESGNGEEKAEKGEQRGPRGSAWMWGEILRLLLSSSYAAAGWCYYILIIIIACFAFCV